MVDARTIIETAIKEGRKKLLEHESLDLLRAYDVPVAPYAFVKDEEEAEKKAEEVGFPAVVKVVSPDIVHKSDVGGVIIGLNSKEDIVKAVQAIRKNVAEKAPRAKITGFLIQKMMPKGIEVIVGAIRDPVFDAAVMFGLGGIFVEVLRDVSFRVAPVTKEDALEMIREIKAAKILQGYRGEPPRDLEALADIIVKVSKLMLDIKEVSEMDINPIISYEKGAYAVDARFILRVNGENK